VNFGKAWGILELTIDFVLMAELGAPGSVLFEFHSNLLAIRPDAKVDISEGTSSNSLRYTVFRNGGLHLD